MAELPLNEQVTLRVLTCRSEAAQALCVEVYPSENVAVQFLEPQLKVFSKASGSTAELAFKKIAYNVACHGPTLADRDANCQSSTASPLLGNATLETRRIRIEKIGSNFFYLEAYEFAPTVAFKGATVSATLFARFRRKYEAVTPPFQLSPDDEFVVTVPKVRVESLTLDVPQISFKHVTEKVCLPNRPLSLQ